MFQNFQNALDIILSGVRWATFLVSIYDSDIFCKNSYQHVMIIVEVLTLLRKAAITLNLHKCLFSIKVNYLSRILLSEGLAAVSKTTDASTPLSSWPTVYTRKNFLSSCNVYRRSVKGFSVFARPQNYYSRTDEKLYWSDPRAETLDTFGALES